VCFSLSNSNPPSETKERKDRMTGITYSDETPFEWIADHNQDLISQINSPNFDADIKLDPTLNGAERHIHLANEMIVKYPQGAFPLEIAKRAIDSTYALLAAVENKFGRAKIKVMSQVFRRAINLWYYSGDPMHPRDVFLKQLFTSESELFHTIEAVNREMTSDPHDPNLKTIESKLDTISKKASKISGKADFAIYEASGQNPIFKPVSKRGISAVKQQMVAMAIAELQKSDALSERSVCANVLRKFVGVEGAYKSLDAFRKQARRLLNKNLGQIST